MSSREARGFLAAICSNPEDDTARLVFADWLDEQGNAPRAEFIRVQVERAALPEWDARRVRLLMRERALLAQHEAAWRAELPAVRGVTWGPFRRGFVAEKYGVLIDALYAGRVVQHIETLVKFEDGRSGLVAADLRIEDAKVQDAAMEATA